MAAARDARRERFGVIPGARRRVWSGVRRMSGHLAGAGVQAPSRRKQRGRREGDVGDGRFVNKLKFKMQFVNSIFLPIPKVK